MWNRDKLELDKQIQGDVGGWAELQIVSPGIVSDLVDWILEDRRRRPATRRDRRAGRIGGDGKRRREAGDG